MSDFDLERLGNVWRQQPDPAELEAIRRSADTVRRRARWAGWVDNVAAVVVAGVVLLLVLMNPQIDTLLVGGAAILIVLAGQYRQRRLRMEELKLLAGSAEEMLDQSIVRVRATVKRNRLQLVWIAPCILLGMAVAAIVDRTSSIDLQTELITDPRIGTIVIAVAVGALAATIVHLVHALRRAREELLRLQALRAAYRHESESAEEG